MEKGPFLVVDTVLIGLAIQDNRFFFKKKSLLCDWNCVNGVSSTPRFLLGCHSLLLLAKLFPLHPYFGIHLVPSLLHFFSSFFCFFFNVFLTVGVLLLARMTQGNFSLRLYCTWTVFCTKPQRRLYILNVKLEATGQPSGWGAEGNVSFYYLYSACSVDRVQHIHSDKGAKGSLEGSEVRCFTVRVTEVWKAFSSQPSLNYWLCFPRRLCFCGLTHARAHTH